MLIMTRSPTDAPAAFNDSASVSPLTVAQETFTLQVSHMLVRVTRTQALSSAIRVTIPSSQLMTDRNRLRHPLSFQPLPDVYLGVVETFTAEHVHVACAASVAPDVEYPAILAERPIAAVAEDHRLFAA